MKKVIGVLAFLCTVSVSTLMAQPPGGRNFDPAKMKERQLQQLKESGLNLTDAQADSVVSVNMEARQQMRGLRDLSDDQRQAKMKELNDYRLKRWTEALKDETLAKKVADYYEKERGNRMNGGGRRQQQ